MYNLIKFITKYHLSFIFVFLEIIAIFLIVQNNRYHKAGFINSANFLTGTIYEKQNNISIYLKLKDENQKLAQENASLRSQIKTINYRLIPNLTQDSLHNDSILLDTLFENSENQFDYLPALAISNSINKRFNYIYLNKGEKDGIYKDMGVIEFNGVIGVVVNTSNSYAMVMPLINEKSRLSVKIDNQGYFGTLEWYKGDVRFATINEIPKHVILNKGDTIVTSGYSQIFPEGLMVGVVEETIKEKGNSFLKVKIKLSVDFAKINHTYTINNKNIDSFKEIYIE